MTLRPRDRIALVAILLLVLVGAYYLLALKPERHKLTALDAAITTQQQTLAQEQQQYAAGRAAQVALHANAAEWTAIRLAVPTESDVPALLRTLQRTANAAHVTMQTIALSSASSSATAQPNTTASTAAASSTGGATSVPITLTFAGGYVALDNLVRRLDGFVVISGNRVHATGPLMSISSVALTGTPKLVAQLTATIYELPASATTGAAMTTIGSK